MNIIDALQSLHVTDTTLSPDEKLALDQTGFLHLRSILTMKEVDALRHRQAELLAAEGSLAGSETYTEPGADCMADLINKGRVFHIVLHHPRVLAAVAHVLHNDMKLSSLNSRSALPGHGLQELHADWEEAEAPGDWQVCNSIWLLDPFTPANGATRIVPGSHASGKLPRDEMPDPMQPHPNQILLLGEAGDVFVLNAHTWHGGTTNRSDSPRRAMHAYFCRRCHDQQLDQRKHLRDTTKSQLSDPARVLLGVD